MWSGAVTPTSATSLPAFPEPAGDAAAAAGRYGPRPWPARCGVEGKATAAPSRRRDGRVVVEYRLEGLRPGTEYFAGFRPASGTRARFRTFGTRVPSASRWPLPRVPAAPGWCRCRTSRTAASSTPSPSSIPICSSTWGTCTTTTSTARPRSPTASSSASAARLDRVLSQEHQALLYRNTPFAYTWDDHDYGPDDADSRSGTREAARALLRASTCRTTACRSRRRQRRADRPDLRRRPRALPDDRHALRAPAAGRA